MKRVLGYLVAILIIYVGLLLVLRVFENRLIYFPDIPGRLSGDWQPRGLPVEDVWLHTSDAVKLHAWWIAAPGAEFTFVAFHGNAANIANRADMYQVLRSVPANVLAVEYRGYGKSEGKPDEAGLYLDAQAAYEYLVKDRGVPAGRVVALGHSLGTAVATNLASKSEVGGLVLEAPFASGAAVARRVYPFLPGLGSVLNSKFDTGKKLALVHAPVLVVHCKDDPVIPFAMGEEVFRLAREPKTFVRIEGFCHEEAALMSPDVYRQKLREFLAAIPTK
ncbi:MAG: alpha/beta hydrolase [Acidobacteria bacterium]|nr:alpha/beta hydrolase [Acidobacteriota bacterium]